MADSEKAAVRVSRDLYEQISRKVRESGGEFKDVEEYVDFVFRELLSGEESAGLRREDEEQIKDRLKSLGYI